MKGTTCRTARGTRHSGRDTTRWDTAGPRLILREMLPPNRVTIPTGDDQADQAREAVAYYFHGVEGRG